MPDGDVRVMRRGPTVAETLRMSHRPWPMGVDLPEVAPEAARCSACLDSRKCWVCLGKGTNEDRYGKHLPCAACGGSGVCPHCLTVFPRQRAG